MGGRALILITQKTLCRDLPLEIGFRHLRDDVNLISKIQNGSHQDDGIDVDPARTQY